MKARVYEITITAAFFLLMAGSVWAGPAGEIKKVYHRSYPATDNTLLMIDNKFGDINFISGNRDSILIEAVVTIEYPASYSKGKELIRYITVSFDRSGRKIEAVTTIDNSFINKWYPRNEKKRFRIDYTVHAPATIDLTVVNKYGDLFINELAGRADLTIKYGYLKINQLLRSNQKPLNHLYLAYSKGTVEKAGWLMLELKYSRLEIGEGQAFAGESKYSELRIERVSSLVMESKYDNYRLGTLNNLVLVASYGTIRVGEVRKKLSLESRYTDVEVDHIPPGFSSIDIDNAYGNVRIRIDEKASYYLEGNTSYCKINHPEARINKIVKNGSYEVKGLIGTDPNTRSRVKIYSKYHAVTLY